MVRILPITFLKLRYLKGVTGRLNFCPIMALGPIGAALGFSGHYDQYVPENGMERLSVRACSQGDGGPQVGEVTRLCGVTRLSI